MKLPRMVEGDNGWTIWIQPTTPRYKLACCDCGLVHDVEIGIVREVGMGGHLEDENNPSLHVVYRARRNNRSTAQMRRHRPAAATPSEKGSSNPSTGRDTPT